MFVQRFFNVVLFLEIFFESTIYFSCLVFLMGIHLWHFDNVAIETRAQLNSVDFGLLWSFHLVHYLQQQIGIERSTLIL